MKTINATVASPPAQRYNSPLSEPLPGRATTMQTLLTQTRTALAERAQTDGARPLPFSLYCATSSHQLVNVPVIRPTLICVLQGCKQIGQPAEVTCQAGQFLFLSNRPTLAMRNIPGEGEYAALVIEFDYPDFACFSQHDGQRETFFSADIDRVLAQTLAQFVSWTTFAPPSMWPLRRQELLQLLYHTGHVQVSTVMEPPSLSHRLFSRIRAGLSDNPAARQLASELHISEATLRRRLSAEGTSLQAIRDQARLSYGLHLVQSSRAPIGQIAEQCGYQSQSRFTDRFRQRFGITPTGLRKSPSAAPAGNAQLSE